MSRTPMTPSLSGAHLKYLACAAMLADHLCKALPLPQVLGFFLSGILGRIAFPLFCFLLAEGFFHTHSRGKYIRNLLVLALVSELPFDLALHQTLAKAPCLIEFSQQNTCFTLLLGLLLFWCLDRIRQLAISLLLSRILQGAALLLTCAAAWILHTDYGPWGILCLAACYLLGKVPVSAAFWGCLMLNLDCLAVSGGQLTLATRNLFDCPGAFLALIPLYFYNGSRGKQVKYGFYLFYPGHLLLLFLLRLLLNS